MNLTIQKLTGANMDIDLITPERQIVWQQDPCPWNKAKNTDQHKCALKNTSICQYFRGVEYLDVVLCSYPNNIHEFKNESTFTIQGPSLNKADLCEPVLGALPDWFGIDEANQNYLNAIDQLPTFLAFKCHNLVGFLTLKQHFLKTAEVFITGVLPQYHRQGLGRAMLCAAEIYLRDRSVEFLQVKTLSESHPDPGYTKTRAFYQALGFTPLEEFKTLWDEANPALLLIKAL